MGKGWSPHFASRCQYLCLVPSFTIPNWPKWAMQSHLLGTPEIFVGFPDSTGVVRSCRTFAVAEKPPAQHRIDWGARVIHSLRTYCASCPENAKGILKVWRVEARKKNVDIRELHGKEIQTLNKGGVPRNGIIPISFMEGLRRKGGE
jgi:hypothetical protein